MGARVARVLIVFHSGEGQTAKIAEHVASMLRGGGREVDVARVEDAPSPDGYDGVVVGDPIHVQRHSRAMTKWLRDHMSLLRDRPTALFQVSMVSADGDEEHTLAAHALVQKLLDDTGFDPDVVGMFAGALAYTQYGWFTKRVMRSIAKHEGGETDTSRDYEYTDWSAVDQFARDVGSLVTASQA
jgi:menaquinone-dependent protoporphyrinogen oxidase